MNLYCSLHLLIPQTFKRLPPFLKKKSIKQYKYFIYLIFNYLKKSILFAVTHILISFT